MTMPKQVELMASEISGFGIAFCGGNFYVDGKTGSVRFFVNLG